MDATPLGLSSVVILLRWSFSKIVSDDLALHSRWPTRLLICNNWNCLTIFFRTTGWNVTKFEYKGPCLVPFHNCVCWPHDGYYIVILSNKWCIFGEWLQALLLFCLFLHFYQQCAYIVFRNVSKSPKQLLNLVKRAEKKRYCNQFKGVLFQVCVCNSNYIVAVHKHLYYEKYNDCRIIIFLCTLFVCSV